MQRQYFGENIYYFRGGIERSLGSIPQMNFKKCFLSLKIHGLPYFPPDHIFPNLVGVPNIIASAETSSSTLHTICEQMLFEVQLPPFSQGSLLIDAKYSLLPHKIPLLPYLIIRFVLII